MRSWSVIPVLVLMALVAGLTGTAHASDRGPGDPDGDLPVYGSGAAYSQPGQPRFQRLGPEDGLSQVSINAIVQDSRGFMWFGTQDGLNRYDGASFRVYKPDLDNPNSLSYQFITALAADPAGGVWVGTNSGGLNYFDPQTGGFVHYLPDKNDPGSLRSSGVTALAVDRAGRLWVGGDQGLDRFDPQTRRFTHLDLGDMLWPSPPAVKVLYLDQQGSLWVGAQGGLAQIKPDGSLHVFRSNPAEAGGLPGEAVQAITQDRLGVLWVGTDQGLARLEAGGNFTRFDIGSGLSDVDITALWEDRLGVLWVATRSSGLNWLDRGAARFQALRTDPGDSQSLGSDALLTLYEDRSGILWIGSATNGLSLLSRLAERFAQYRVDSSSPDGRPGQVDRSLVWSIYEDQAGALWLGANGGGLSRLERASGEWAHYMHTPVDPDSLAGNTILAIAGAPGGDLWLALHGVDGLERFNPKTGKTTHLRHDPSDPASIADDCPLSLLVDSHGALWVGLDDAGLDRLDPASGKFTHFPVSPDGSDGIAGPHVWALDEAPDGTIWVGTAYGLSAYEPATGQFTHYRRNEAANSGLSSNLVLGLYDDGQGSLWIGTAGGGLNRLERVSGHITHFTEKDGLPNNVVYGILDDGQGCLWLSTNAGLSCYNPQSERFLNYGLDDGLVSLEFNNGAFFQSPSGELFFGGVKGFNSFRPEQARIRNPYEPPVVLTGLSQGGEPLQLDRPAERLEMLPLRWPENSFEFSFAGLSYIHPEQNQYSYMLEGFEKSWNFVQTQRSGRYTNLPGGTYTLRIRAANNDGVWSNPGAALVVQVTPPVWETWWFRLGLLALLGGTVFAVYRLRVSSIQARNRQLEQLVIQRTYALRERSLELEHSAAAIQRHSNELEEMVRSEQHRAGQFQTLAEVGRRIGPLLEVNTALEQVVKLVQESFGYYHVGIGLVEGDEVVYRYGAGQLWQDAEFEFRPRRLKIGQEGLTGQCAALGEPVLARDVSQEPRYVCMQGSSTRSELVVPILAKERVLGVLDAQSDRLDAFDETDVAALQTLAHQVGAALENARLYEQAQAAAVLQERSRLARELHDAVTQTLFSASLLAEALPAAWEADPQEGHKLIRELRQLNRGALAEMRSLLMELRPSALAEANLADLLRQLADAAAGREGIPVTVRADGACDLPPDVRIALYRIAQEALNNVVKHARASQASLTLHCERRSGRGGRNGKAPKASVMLEVCDDGRGFDLHSATADHMGLKIMRERAQAVGAALEVESEAKKGTRVRVRWQTEDGKGV